MTHPALPTSDPGLDESVAPLLPGMDIEAGAELLQDPAGPTGPAHSGKIVERNQARVQAILAARAMGLSIRQVCAAYEVGAHTLAEIERRHGAKLATLKERFARRLGAFVELGLDRMLESVGTMDADKLPLAVAICIDKLQVLTGEPSIIVGDGGPRRFSVDALRDRLDGAIDVTPVATGLPAGDDLQRGGTAAAGSEAGDLVADEGGSDCVSED